MKLAVLGDPLRHTSSPALHEAGLAALGIDGVSRAIPTTVEQLPARLDELEAQGFHGANLTTPLKEAVLPLLGSVSTTAARTRSVNTVGFGPDGRWGDTTDGTGMLEFLATEAIVPAEHRVLLLGAGGAARSVADTLVRAGAKGLIVATRRPGVHAPALAALGFGLPLAFDSDAADDAYARATLILHATPARDLDGPLDPARVAPGAVAVDMGYGPELTLWVRALRGRGVRAMDGLGMLIHQARRSIMLWTGREPPLAPLEAAVGWPR